MASAFLRTLASILGSVYVHVTCMHAHKTCANHEEKGQEDHRVL